MSRCVSYTSDKLCHLGSNVQLWCAGTEWWFVVLYAVRVMSCDGQVCYAVNEWCVMFIRGTSEELWYVKTCDADLLNQKRTL